MAHRYNTPYGRSIRVQRLGKDGLPDGGAVTVEAEAFAMTWAGDELTSHGRTALVFAGEDACYRMSWDAGDPMSWTTTTTGVTVSPMTNTDEAEVAAHTCADCGEEFATVWEASNPAEHECPGPRATAEAAVVTVFDRMAADVARRRDDIITAAGGWCAPSTVRYSFDHHVSDNTPVHVPADPNSVVLQ